MINIQRLEECCGCTACEAACAHGALEMKPDAMGFLYPVVDASKCVDCGLCDRVCAFNDHYDRSLNLQQPDAYGARHKNMEEVATSRSGAAFIALSDVVLRQGGAVYGAGFTDHFRVVHKRATTRAERDEFKGSKYVQSNMRGIHKLVRKDLLEGRIVMFSGTPCQTASLRSFIPKKLQEKLFLVDIVCHGVPGPNIWRDYLKHLEEKQGDEIVWVNFRDKQQFGWKAHHESFKFKRGGGNVMTFKDLFYKHIMFRPSCHECHFTNTTRPSDITLADFWGWEKSNPEANKDDKGISLLLINTEKGRRLFEEAKADLEYFPVNLDDAMQPQLKQPTVPHSKSRKFADDYARRGFDYVFNKNYDPLSQTLRDTSNRLKKKTKRAIKKALGERLTGRIKKLFKPQDL